MARNTPYFLIIFLSYDNLLMCWGCFGFDRRSLNISVRAVELPGHVKRQNFFLTGKVKTPSFGGVSYGNNTAAAAA